MIFFIVSSINHFNKRIKIKKSWIKLCKRISCNYYFVIATKNYLYSIKNQYERNIIGIDIIDNYYNLTILSSNIYKYYTLFKLRSDYIIKNDDDIYPNIPIIYLYINTYIDKYKISGYFYAKMKVNRDENSSVYLPYSLYPSIHFPSFVAGGFVITHSSLIPSIYKELLKEKKIIYREDMHLAVIYSKLKIAFQNINRYYHRKEKNIMKIKKHKDICFHGF